MGFYKFGLCLLLCSHQLFASSYWSHLPGFGSVQLTELDPQQHRMLSVHLKLSAADTKEWLSRLPELLDTLSCSTVDVQSQSLPAYIDAGYRVVSYAGVLKFHTDDKDKSTVWWLPWSQLPSLSGLQIELTEPAVQIHQPLLLTEQELKRDGQFIIVSGSSNLTYFALELNTMHLPELLWSISSVDAGFEALAGAMAQPVLLTEQSSGFEKATLSLLLPNTAATDQRSLVYKVEALTGRLQSRLVAQQKMTELSGAVTLYDQNRDSVPETLLFSTKSGQLWQTQIDGNLFYNMQLIADLSGLELSDVQFIRTLYAAVPVGGSASDFHSRRSQWLVLLSALQHDQSVFVVLKHQAGSILQASDLVSRTVPDAPALAVLTDQEWQQIQQKNGWYSPLAGRLSHAPVVVAGVVYMRALNPASEQFCSMENATSVLLALHLHHASVIYRPKVFPAEKATGMLAVKANAEGGFALIDQHHQQILIENIVEISPDCTHCSSTMKQSSFPRWQLMGTYHSEEGAYE